MVGLAQSFAAAIQHGITDVEQWLSKIEPIATHDRKKSIDLYRATLTVNFVTLKNSPNVFILFSFACTYKTISYGFHVKIIKLFLVYIACD